MYQLGHKRPTKWWLMALFIILLLVLLYFVGGLGWLVGLFTRLASPLQSGMYQAGTEVAAIRSRAELTAENEKLKQELSQVTADVSQLNSLEAENQILKQQLNFLEGQPYKFVTARVISGTSQDNLSALVINRGSRDGVKAGCPVIVGEGVLVGKVIETRDSISTILLLTDGQSKIAATIQNKDRTIGVVEGEHGLSIKLDMIPRDEEIKAGDIVVTSGLQQNIPSGLLIGLIDKIDATSSELFSKAYLYPLTDYQKVNFVTVLISD